MAAGADAGVAAAVDAAVGTTLERTALGIGVKVTGKVRDVYDTGSHMVLVTTDRLSAFDRALCAVPLKGAVLNMTSAFWFNATKHIVPNHVLAVPHPNVTIAKRCTPFKIEFVVRAYLTGSTGTSIWMHYQAGARSYCGHLLPDGMVKNQPLPTVICTPTTKEESHDRPISAAEVVGEGWMTAAEWEYTQGKALELFAFGAAHAAAHNLILVDTKYEFGKDAAGVIHVIDEMHTPDSSRYWVADTYAARLAAGLEPEFFDKEFLRVWYRDHCDPYADAVLPTAPPELVTELSRRYVTLYHRITGGDVAALLPPPGTTMRTALAAHFPPAPARIVVVRDADTGSDAAATAALLRSLPPCSHTPPTHGATWRDATAVAVELYPATHATLAPLAAALAADAPHVPSAIVVVATRRLDAAAAALAAAARTAPVVLVTGAVDAGAAAALPLATAAAVAAASSAAPYAVVADPAAAAAFVLRSLRMATH